MAMSVIGSGSATVRIRLISLKANQFRAIASPDLVVAPSRLPWRRIATGPVLTDRGLLLRQRRTQVPSLILDQTKSYSHSIPLTGTHR